MSALTAERFSAGRVKLFFEGEFAGQVQRHNLIWVVSLYEGRDVYKNRLKENPTNQVTDTLKDGTPIFHSEEDAISYLETHFII